MRNATSTRQRVPNMIFAGGRVVCSLQKCTAAILKTQNPDDADVMSVYHFTDPVCLLLL